jgi:hypothetical protein
MFNSNKTITFGWQGLILIIYSYLEYRLKKGREKEKERVRKE